VLPNVTGVGTATWTVRFAGPSAPGGVLRPGSYRLNFTGNNLIGNGRAVDTANTGAVAGSDRQIVFNVAAPSGDYNRDGQVNAADVVVWRKLNGQTGPNLAADGDGDMDVDDQDYLVWRTNFGNTSTATIVPGAGSAASVANNVADSSESAALTAEDNLEPIIGGILSPNGTSDVRGLVFGEWSLSRSNSENVGTPRLQWAKGGPETSPVDVRQLLLGITSSSVHGDDHRDSGELIGRTRHGLQTIDEFYAKLGDDRFQPIKRWKAFSQV
jgi:hypothetical protein